MAAQTTVISFNNVGSELCTEPYWVPDMFHVSDGRLRLGSNDYRWAAKANALGSDASDGRTLFVGQPSSI